MMTLGNMRANGVRSLAVSRIRCHHGAVLDVEAYGDEVTVPSFGPRMVCTACGAMDADARPNWNERASPNLYNKEPAVTCAAAESLSLWRPVAAG